MTYKTEQEVFWSGKFGDAYIDRNLSDGYLASNLNFFSKTLARAGKPDSLIEFGANIGMNLRAIKMLFPLIHVSGVEINEKAAEILASHIGRDAVYTGSIFDYPIQKKFDVSLIKGVLIHTNPDMLSLVYRKLYESSNKFILICEYYNPSPVEVPYRGHHDRLFKRDFAGEILDTYNDLELIDYGFCYKRDAAFPQDDINWFLIAKK